MPALRPFRTLAAVAASVLLITGLALPAGAATSGDVGWTVQTVDNGNGAGRGSFSYDLDPGQSVTDAMRVMNTGTAPLPLEVYAADAFTTAGGDIDLVPDGMASVDAGLWVAVETPQITLQPGEQVDIPFTITAPADAMPGDHAAGLVTSFVSRDDTQTLSVDRRLGTRVNVRVSGALVPEATIENVRASYSPSWNPFEAGTLTVDYSLHNTGNTRLSGVDGVHAAGPVGLLASTAPAQQLAEVIPGSTLEVRRTLPVLSLGWLSGSVVIDAEGVGLGAGQIAPIVTDFSAVAVPWSLLVLLVLVAAVAVGAILLARRRARAPKVHPLAETAPDATHRRREGAPSASAPAGSSTGGSGADGAGTGGTDASGSGQRAASGPEGQQR